MVGNNSMKDFITIGPTPLAEPCSQMGKSYYKEFSIMEIKAFINQCKRTVSKEFNMNYLPKISSKTFTHDFGSYQEVVVYYDNNNEKQVEQAYWLEAHTDEFWDDEALQELRSYNYDLSLNH